MRSILLEPFDEIGIFLIIWIYQKCQKRRVPILQMNC